LANLRLIANPVERGYEAPVNAAAANNRDVVHDAYAGDPPLRPGMRLGLRVGAAAALLGGLAWTIKGAAILIADEQPPSLFEAGPAMFGVWLLSAGLFAMPSARRRVVVLSLACVSTISGGVALVSELTGELIGAALAVSSVALLAGLLSLDRHAPWPLPVAWWLGAVTAPALLVGGMLSAIDERLLEIPVVVVGLGWMLLGVASSRLGDSGATLDPRRTT
jgi:hypothetical protein